MTELVSKSQRDDLTKSSEAQPESTNLSSKRSLIRRLRKDRSARTNFVDSHINKTLAFQIRSLRGNLSQEQAVEKLGMNQNAISRLENPSYGKATLTTLKRIASAYDVGLLVEFVPFSRLVNRVSGTPQIDLGLTPATMAVSNFDEEEMQGVFENQPIPPAPQPQIRSWRWSARFGLPVYLQADTPGGMAAMFFRSNASAVPRQMLGTSDETVPMIPVPDSASGLGAEGPMPQQGE